MNSEEMTGEWSESVHLPVFADGEALPQAAIFVRFGEQPRRVHEVFALEVFRDFFIPHGNVSRVAGSLVDDGPTSWEC